MSNKRLGALLGSAAGLLFATGLQLSGYTNRGVGVALVCAAAIAGAASVWPKTSSRLLRIVREYWTGVLGFLVVNALIQLLLYGAFEAGRYSAARAHDTPPAGVTPPPPPPDTADRVFVRMQPREILSLIGDEFTSDQAERLKAPYLGKWFRAFGYVNDIRTSPDGSITVEVMANPDESSWAVCDVPAAKAGGVTHLRKNDRIAMDGRLAAIWSTRVELEDCALVQY